MAPLPPSTLQGRRVLIATLGSLGDLHPMLALGAILQRAGAQVRVATSTIYQERVQASGADFLPLGPSFSTAEMATQVQQLLDNPHSPRLLIRDLLMPMTRQSLEQLLDYSTDSDLLINGEAVFAAPLVVALRETPWISVTLSPMPLLSIHDPPVLPQAPWLQHLRGLGSGVQSLLVGIGRWQSQNWCQEVYTLRRELGLAQGGHPLFEAKHSPTLSLGLFSPLLASPQADWPNSMQVSGFLYHQETTTLDPTLEAFLQAGPPPLVFTLGSAAVMHPGRFFVEALTAIKSLGLRAVLLHGDTPLPTPLPPTVLGVNYAPHGLLFSRAMAVVHAGGIGTTARVLQAGIPMLVVPQANDQPDNAARIVRLGVGLSLPRERLHKTTLVPALAQLCHDPQLRQRARDVAYMLALEDPPGTTLKAIEGLLQRC